jgi:geranylgeranyl diphosphate synthase, type I
MRAAPGVTTTILASLQTRFGRAIDDEIRALLDRLQAAPGLTTLLQYQLGYVDAEGRVSSSEGKRFRPALCLFSCEAAGGAWKAALRVAAAIELLHNFSLIHDDIEDHDPIRRHRPTVWRVWGEPQAINAGDAMFSLAGRAVLDSAATDETTLSLGRRFQETALALTRGQYLDMSFEGRATLPVTDYLDMITLKSAELIGFSVWAGSTIAGRGEGVGRCLHEYGIALGRAFQIQDDIQGIWGDPRVTGKVKAKDLHNRKRTLPTIVAWDAADSRQRTVLEGFFTAAHDDVSAVISVLDEVGARQRCINQASRYREAAHEALLRARLPVKASEELEALVSELTG